jgi:hypothetical protein
MTITTIDFAAIANRMRNRARSGECRGEPTVREAAYIKHCGTRVGTTTLLFTRDVDQHACGWLANPAHDRCWHLSISCNDTAERDAWLRAFFGDEIDRLWAAPPESSLGRETNVWHWRLFCDEGGNAIATDPCDPELRRQGFRHARELGVSTQRRFAA